MSKKSSNWRNLEILLKYGYSYRRNLWFGLLGTVCVVFFRLAIPWPLRGIIEIVFPEKEVFLMNYLPEGVNAVIFFSATYVLISVLLGLSQMLQRINIKKYASLAVHDLREGAVNQQTRLNKTHGISSGDMISRIIGDSARVKVNLSGILTHLSQNLFYFIAVCVVMLFVSLKLGLLFLLAGSCVIFIGFWYTRPLVKVTAKYRQKEGEFANYLEEQIWDSSVTMSESNLESARKDVKSTRILAQSSLITHSVLAIILGISFWMAVQDVNKGLINPGEIFIFIAYSLTVHHRLVPVGRQIARIGKVFANLDRMVDLLGDQAGEEISHVPMELTEGITLKKVTYNPIGIESLKIKNLKLEPNSNVAVRSKVSSGSSSLIQILAGIRKADEGKIMWDGKKIKSDELYKQVAYISNNPALVKGYIWQILGLKSPDIDVETQNIMEKLGVWQLISKFQEGLNTKVKARDISKLELKLLLICNVALTSQKPIWIIERPFEEVSKQKASIGMEELMKLKKNLLIVTYNRIDDIKDFDQLINLKKGKIKFKGTPDEYSNFKENNTI